MLEISVELTTYILVMEFYVTHILDDGGLCDRHTHDGGLCDRQTNDGGICNTDMVVITHIYETRSR